MKLFSVMRFLALLLILTLNVLSAKAEWTGNTSAKLQAFALKKVFQMASDSFTKAMVTACRKDLGWFDPSVIYNCYRASNSLTQSLDLKVANQGILAYSTDMAELMESPETSIFLKDLVNYYRPKSGENTLNVLNRQGLWEWTLAHPASYHSAEKALQLIGILFQDTTGNGDGFIRVSMHQSHVNGALNQWDEAHTLLMDAIQYAKSHLLAPSNLKMDSEGLDSFKLYHFYAIAYAAYKVTKDMKDPRYGFLLPFLMNRGYEFISIRLRETIEASSKDRPGEVAQSPFESFFNVLLNPPQVKSQDLRLQFDSEALGDAHHDIYLGYRGALFGASLAAGKSLTSLSRAEFETAFSRSPFEFTSLATSLIDQSL